MSFVKLFDAIASIEVQTQVVPTKGNLVYEYNPFRNFRLSQNMYEYKNSIYSQEELNKKFGIAIKEEKWMDSLGNDVTEDITLREKGELVDFITEQLNFSLDHPVHIIPQYSYDGSVNLILNDGINTPRLINSRFSATGRNTYEVVDRKGNNDTNIYDQGDQFDIDTSLYKRVVKIPKIDFKGISAGGNLKVGNYHFYFKLSDADGNETDFVGESGLVSVFIGFNDYFSVTTGQKNENSFKQVIFQLTNIDSAYDYVTVYYSRNTAEGVLNPVTEYIKIDKKYLVNNASIANVIITGFENTIEVTVSDINLNYNIVDSVCTSAVCQNMLFLGNVHKPDIPYQELQDLSLRFLPYLKEEEYTVDYDHNYNITTTNKGYIDPKFIYDKTGYWGKEIYRFGIVYILHNGELSPVFNVRGNYNIKSFGTKENDDLYLDDQYTYFPVYKDDERNYIQYHEEKYTILEAKQFENIKGVVSFNPDRDTNTIYSVDFRVDTDTIDELKKFAKGYFFVRQTRIPTILAQGVTIGIDKESGTPTIPTAGGFLDDLSETLTKTHVTTEDINDVNFISEGFLSRYSFRFEEKSSSLWGSILKTTAIVAGVVALAAATVFTAGGALAGAGIIAGSALSVTTAVGSTTLGAIAGMAIAGAGVATAVGMTVAAGIQETNYLINRTRSRKKLDGRNTKVPSGFKLVENEDSRKIDQSFLNRIIPKDPSNNYVAGIICPDYSLNQPYYNQVFTGNTHLIQLTKSQNINCLNGYTSNYFTNDERHFYAPAYYDRDVNTSYSFKIIGIPDSVKCIGIDSMKFRSRAGEAEEAWRYECISEDFKSSKYKSTGQIDDETIDNKKINTDIIRGNFGSYLAFNDTASKFQPAETVNIYIPEYSTANMEEYFYLRMVDNSTFFAITDRFDFQDISEKLVNKSTAIVGDNESNVGYSINAYRGDCYLCQYTHRIVRNFNDPSMPYNDEIVDEDTWKENYDATKYDSINLGDVNAVQLGMWITFRLRSSNNLNIRTLDGSNVDETAMQGHPRGYYPYQPMSIEGTYKNPDSEVYNRGFSKSVSERWNFEVPDVPHIKNWFGTRIMYSDIHINDAFKNGFRVFQGTNYRDYTREYGEIVKLVSLESSLLCVFEHGIALIPVNERAVAGQGTGGNVYINTSNVLPENPKIISDIFGSQWAESVLKVQGKYVYGVDTVARKIWRTDGNALQCISDFKVQEFLNNHISLGERELTPKIGIRNVKTFYNAYKQDVMFTFYDNTYGFEEKVWNLCWNETLEKFITFYSWVPSYMENINNIPFSFNRNTSKWIAKLGTSHAENSFADGITLSNVIIDENFETGGLVNTNRNVEVQYLTINNTYKTVTLTIPEDYNTYVGMLSLSNRVLPNQSIPYTITYTIQRDTFKNHTLFKIEEVELNLPDDAKDTTIKVPILCLIETEDSYKEVFYQENDSFFKIQDYLENSIYTYKPSDVEEHIYAELYYRNKAGHSYPDDEINKVAPGEEGYNRNLPIFKDKTGKRIMLEEPINQHRIVLLLNIKATINIDTDSTTLEQYYQKAKYDNDTSLINIGYYESTVAVTTKQNLSLLSTDFWKHGQAGIIDITDEIKPTHWYGERHPFEFECLVVNDPATHKIFTNLEIIANKAKPESFHYEIVGECYDFAKDKVNMYFRQEAMKALWQYNGVDIIYDRNFLNVQTRQQAKSADFIHTYYARQDKINQIEDYYAFKTSDKKVDYRHLAGAEIVYYPNRQEYRIWQHSPAVDIDNELSRVDEINSGCRGLIAGNMTYLEDKWRVTIKPIIVCYRNEYSRRVDGLVCQEANSNWVDARDGGKLPPFAIYNSPIPTEVREKGEIAFPDISTGDGSDNALYGLYKDGYSSIDQYNWLDEVGVYGTQFGYAQNRKEVDLKDKFMKVRVRYSGDELAIINFLNTIYRISYA